jgi:hypothetical protein
MTAWSGSEVGDNTRPVGSVDVVLPRAGAQVRSAASWAISVGGSIIGWMRSFDACLFQGGDAGAEVVVGADQGHAVHQRGQDQVLRRDAPEVVGVALGVPVLCGSGGATPVEESSHGLALVEGELPGDGGCVGGEGRQRQDEVTGRVPGRVAGKSSLPRSRWSAVTTKESAEASASRSVPRTA